MAPGSYRLSGKMMGWHPEVPVVAGVKIYYHMRVCRFLCPTAGTHRLSCGHQQTQSHCKYFFTSTESLNLCFLFVTLCFNQVPGDTAVWPSVFCSVNSLAISLYNTDPSCVHLHRRDVPFATISPEYADNCPSHSQARTAAWTQEHTKVSDCN